MAIALQIIIGGKDMKNEIKKLEHSTYRCQYHIVFAPKYRRKAIVDVKKSYEIVFF